jgi:hypothetical protein
MVELNLYNIVSTAFYQRDYHPSDPEVVVKNMLPAFQAPAQFDLPLDGPKFKSGGLYDPWRGNYCSQ